MAEQFPRTPYDATRGLVYFPRMLDKIRLRATGKLPEIYFQFMGDGFDGRTVRFFKIEYAALQKRVLEGGTDEEIFDWCLAQRGPTSDEEVEHLSLFLLKRAWRDDVRERLEFRMKEAGFDARMSEAKTMFDFIDLDEGRTPPDFSKLEPPAR